MLYLYLPVFIYLLCHVICFTGGNLIVIWMEKTIEQCNVEQSNEDGEKKEKEDEEEEEEEEE